MTKVFGQNQTRPISIPGFIRLWIVALWISICAVASGQQTVVLGWDAPPDSAVAGYFFYYGTTSQNYTNKLDAGTNTIFSVTNLLLGNNYYFAVSSYDAYGLESALSAEVILPLPFTQMLTGAVSASNNVQFLQFQDGTDFGYFNQASFPWIYHFDMGYEYVIEAWDQQNGVYLYDWTSHGFWYTSPSVFPYVYDFALDSWLYYYPDPNKTGHYTTNPRYFYNFQQSKIITR